MKQAHQRGSESPSVGVSGVNHLVLGSIFAEVSSKYPQVAAQRNPVHFILRRGDGKELVLYQALRYESCLAVGQKWKKQLSLYLVICLSTSGAHLEEFKRVDSFDASCYRMHVGVKLWFSQRKTFIVDFQKFSHLTCNYYPSKWHCNFSFLGKRQSSPLKIK